ncbi:hypothetical protein C8R45DRAFT_934003 [Mycena sanguinolenta]|nr:hypothetical protein C8R45DRAFT_934003 [Mycena sanguinolenta]
MLPKTPRNTEFWVIQHQIRAGILPNKASRCYVVTQNFRNATPTVASIRMGNNHVDAALRPGGHSGADTLTCARPVHALPRRLHRQHIRMPQPRERHRVRGRYLGVDVHLPFLESSSFASSSSSVTREFALVGQKDGTAFVGVLPIAQAVYFGRLGMQTVNSTWRDDKVIGILEVRRRGMWALYRGTTPARQASSSPTSPTPDPTAPTGVGAQARMDVQVSSARADAFCSTQCLTYYGRTRNTSARTTHSRSTTSLGNLDDATLRCELLAPGVGRRLAGSERANNSHPVTYIWDIANLAKPVLTGHYSSLVKSNLYAHCTPKTTFTGSWSSCPYFPSGFIVVNSVERGLLIVKYNGEGGTVRHRT